MPQSSALDPLHDALNQHFGFTDFRPQQREAIQHIRDGGDALVLMPTGGGKSLCYQLPAVLSDGLTVVVSPLIALMQEQVQALRANDLRAAYLNSTLTTTAAAQIEQMVANGDIQLLYAAPERVNTPRFTSLLERRPPALIAIDEAHCISEWGHEFRPDYRELRRLTAQFPDVPVAALTATATPQVQRDIVDQLDRPRMQRFATSFMRPNLTLRIVPKRESVERLIERLRELPRESAIVYCRSRSSAEDTAAKLRSARIPAAHYHAGMTGDERARVQDEFSSSQTPVICATIAFGMGIDKPDIRLVAHLDMPPSMEGYYQETGRAGRDGEPSECLLFYTRGVWAQQQYFLRQIRDEREREARIRRLRRMMDFCEQQSCRWSTILKYFGEQPPSESCGHCDNCLGEEEAPADAASPRLVDPADPPGPPGQDAQQPLSPEEDRLFEALRAERSRLANAEATSAYIVASNRELSDIARRKPRTIAELIEIKGIRHRKAARFGQQLLDVVAQHSQEAADTLEETADETAGEMQLTLDTPPEAWQQRFNALAAWRSLTSDNEQCDPSDLLSFPAMREVAEHTPSSIEALSAVDGVGVLAIERYAEELALILGIQPKPSEPPPPTSRTSDAAPSWQVSADLYQDGHTILAIAERRMLSPGTVASHLTTALRNGLDIDLNPALPSTKQIQAVRRELGRDPDASIADLQERLDHRLSHPEIRLVLAHLHPPMLSD